MCAELLPKLDIAFENRLKRESQAIVERTKIEVEDFYASKKGRRMLKIQVADKKKNSHMYTAKEMKKDYVQKEYLAIKTENRLKKVWDIRNARPASDVGSRLHSFTDVCVTVAPRASLRRGWSSSSRKT